MYSQPPPHSTTPTIDNERERNDLATTRAIAFTVDERGAGLRLDQAISFYSPEITRSQASKLIQEGHVRAGSRLALRSHRVYLGEPVEVFIPMPPPSTVQPEPMPLDIYYEDEDILVLSKPAGLVVHPAYGHETGTLVNGLLAHAGSLPDNGLAFRPGIVHRLDKDTSGLLVVAKTPIALANIQQQFKRGIVIKAYLALLAGKLDQPSGVIDLPLARAPHDRQRMAVIPSGRPARTHWRTIEEILGYTLVEARLETGRTHQIRVHFRAIGHPIVGDQLYGEQKHAQGLRRQFLHAHLLQLRHPTTGQELTFRSDLPSDLTAVLTRLREKAAHRPSFST